MTATATPSSATDTDLEEQIRAEVPCEVKNVMVTTRSCIVPAMYRATLRHDDAEGGTCETFLLCYAHTAQTLWIDRKSHAGARAAGCWVGCRRHSRPTRWEVKAL